MWGWLGGERVGYVDERNKHRLPDTFILSRNKWIKIKLMLKIETEVAEDTL